MRYHGHTIAQAESGGYTYEYPIDLHFTCERCGLCCGDTKCKTRRILLLEKEVEHISGVTSQDANEFSNTIENQWPFIYIMRKSGGKCVFLKGKLCSIYDIRPIICRFYPFKLENLGDNRYSFSPTEECPGVGKGSKLGCAFYENLFRQFLKSLTENRGKTKVFIGSKKET